MMRALKLAWWILLVPALLPAKSRLLMIDGFEWVQFSHETKRSYIVGTQDATGMAYMWAHDEAVKELHRHFPMTVAANGDLRYSAGTDDLVESLDRFYEESANRPLGVPVALEVMALKYHGASAECQETVTLFWRRFEQRVALGDLAQKRDACLAALRPEQ